MLHDRPGIISEIAWQGTRVATRRTHSAARCGWQVPPLLYLLEMERNHAFGLHAHPAGTLRARAQPPRSGREMTALGLEGPVLIIAGKTVIGLLAHDLAAEPGGGRAEACGPPLRRRMLAGARSSEVKDAARRAEGPDDRRRGGRQGPRHRSRGRRRPGPARGQLPHGGLERRSLQCPIGHLFRRRGRSRNTGSTARIPTWSWSIPR